MYSCSFEDDGCACMHDLLAQDEAIGFCRVFGGLSDSDHHPKTSCMLLTSLAPSKKFDIGVFRYDVIPISTVPFQYHIMSYTWQMTT